ncbi:MAG: hypothetical protein M3068_12460, partial [Gemmatimonadota bacterium]|nr:hypothetical protein [Gemmatimonadota bacterium]
MTEFSRREFLQRAGQVGGALAIASPALGFFLRATAAEGSPLVERAVVPDLGALASGLRWRLLGPFRGGRCAAASGVVGRPHEFYFGAVNGGVWKTIDAGRVWAPVFDAQPVASIGAIAVAPSSPDVVYVGSGESTLRDSAGYGNGMYKSVDAGKSWTHIGLADTQHIGKIAIHPRNPDIVFVAAIGHLYAANPERGVFRTTDGGRSWKKVLDRGEQVGAVEVVLDPTDPRVVYAGLWNTRRPPWFTYAPTNGPGGGIWKSSDGGDTWTQLTNGLPKDGIGRTGIAVAPSDPRRVYAVVDCLVPDPHAPPPPSPASGRPSQQELAMLGGFFRSDDAGATWTRLSSDPALWSRGWYFEKVSVDPKNADVVYVSNVAVNRSMDGGKSWIVLRGSPGGDDYHQVWIDPTDSGTAIVAGDQGAIITHNATAADPRDVTWSSWLNQPTAQLYHISVDYRFPYWVTGAQQDSGAVAVRSRGKFAEISIRDWEPIGAGGESGLTAGDPLHPGIIYGEMGNRHDLETNMPVPGTTAPTAPSASEPLRADWTQPLVFSRADPRALYYAAQFLFRTTDGAKTWTRISPDLTRAEPGVPVTLDAAATAATDRNGKRGVIYAVAPSPLIAATIWVGTDDGYIQLTTDDGKSWRNVTPSAISAWSRVTAMEASHFDAGAAYASVDRHQLQDFEPYLYRTRDMGKSWQPITRGLPRGVYVHVVKEDPRRKGLLICGTERGAFVSMDDGDEWQPLQLNLPVTSVRDFEFYGDDLIVGTHGRGIWVMDDISPLRQIDASVLASEVHLFTPAAAIDYVQGDENGTPLQRDDPQSENPPAGAVIDYYLKNGANGPVTLEILDAGGRSVRTYSSEQESAPGGRRRQPAPGGLPRVSPLWQTVARPLPTSAGLHRVAWEPVMTEVPGAAGGPERPPVRLTGSFTA